MVETVCADPLFFYESATILPHGVFDTLLSNIRNSPAKVKRPRIKLLFYIYDELMHVGMRAFNTNADEMYLT